MISVFQDLAARFLYNLPQEEIKGMRLMYHIEQMFFYFKDQSHFYQKYHFLKFEDIQMNLRNFIDQFSNWFQAISVYPKILFYTLWNEYVEVYKKEIPVAGAIIFTSEGQSLSVLCVKGKDSNKWGFPKGKRNQYESWFACAQREVQEETGWNGWRILHQHKRKTHKVKPRFHDLKKHNLLPFLTDSLTLRGSQNPTPLSVRKPKRDFSTPRRPQTLVNLEVEETKFGTTRCDSHPLPPNISSSFRIPPSTFPTNSTPTSNNSETYPLFFYLNLHHIPSNLKATLPTANHYRKPITPTRIYFLYYPMINSLLSQSKIKCFERWNKPDMKEISQVSWLQWDNLAHKLDVTWQLRKHHAILTQAMHLVIRLIKEKNQRCCLEEAKASITRAEPNLRRLKQQISAELNDSFNCFWNKTL